MSYSESMVNTPPSGERPESEGKGPSKAMALLRAIGTTVKGSAAKLFKTSIPKALQERGLTETSLQDFDTRFYAMLRGNGNVAQKRIQRSIASGERTFLQSFLAAAESDGWDARENRKREIFNTLIDEFGYGNDTEMVAFLHDQFVGSPPSMG
jgi:hypothetical protein